MLLQNGRANGALRKLGAVQEGVLRGTRQSGGEDGIARKREPLLTGLSYTAQDHILDGGGIDSGARQ